MNHLHIVTQLRAMHRRALAETSTTFATAASRKLLDELGQWLESAFGEALPVAAGFHWGDLPVGGGGYITNVARDRHTGILFAGTDVQNCYVRRRGDTKWATVFRRDTMQPEDMVRSAESNRKGDALASCMGAFAGQHGTRLYSHINASVFTIDLASDVALRETGGIKCRRWNLPHKFMQPNLGLGKFWSPGLAGHPTDEDIALLGTWNDGCYFTSDGGHTVLQLDIPPGSGWPGNFKGRERYLVWIDQTDPSFCYVFVQGTGLHRSAAGVAGPYALIEGGPKMAANLFGEDDGTLWVCGDGRAVNQAGTAYDAGSLSPDAGLWQLAGAEFRFLGNPLSKWRYYPWHAAVDPHDRNAIFCWMEQLGGYSRDRGVTWQYFDRAALASIVGGGEVEWRPRQGLFMGGGFTFTETPGELIGAEGFGVIKIPDYRSGKLLAQDMSAGIEEFIVNNIFVNPVNGRLFLNCWDRHVVEVTDLDAYTARVMMPRGARLSIAHGMDNAMDDPDYYVCSGGSGTPAHSYSEGGRQWTRFAATEEERRITYPDAAGNGSAGAIAMSTRDDIVICQSNNLPAIESRGGRVFRQIRLNGRTDYSTINSYTTAYRKNVSADKTRPGVFAMVVPMTVPGNRSGLNNPLGGLWVRLGIGADWSQALKGRIGSYGETAQFWNCDLKYVPGRPAELLYTGFIGQANAPLVHLFDDGQGQAEIDDVRNVLKFGFGANPGHERPAVLFFGRYRDELGYWLTLDWFKSFEKISDEFPNRYWSSGVASISGDISPGGAGKWFVSVGGKGAVFALRQ